MNKLTLFIFSVAICLICSCSKKKETQRAETIEDVPVLKVITPPLPSDTLSADTTKADTVKPQ